MKKYSDYKDSGIEGIGTVPKHWNIKRGDWAFEHKRETVKVNTLEAEELYLYSIPEVQARGDGKLEKREDVNGRKLLLDGGEILISRLNPRKRSNVIAERQNVPIVASTEFVPLSPKNCDRRFGHYLHLAQPIVERLRSCIQSATRSHKRVSPSDIYRMWNAFPPLYEQNAIADYLDRKTAQIDTLIQKRLCVIDRLEEQRTAEMFRAVTSGVESNTEVVESGVEWLGRVPSHWSVSKLKWVADTASGSTPSTGKQEQYYESGEVSWVQSLDLNEGRIWDTEQTITQVALDECSCNLMPKGTLLVAMYGGSGTIGKTGIMGKPAATNQAVCSLTPSEVLDSDYLHYYLRFYRPYWMVSAMSTRKDPNISQEIVGNAPVLVPPLNEQQRIVQRLTHVESRIDQLANGEREIIERLKELRQSLISEAVTGKIDVREEVPV